MTRLILLTVAVLSLLWILQRLGLLPEPAATAVEPVLGLATSLAVPALFLTANPSGQL